MVGYVAVPRTQEEIPCCCSDVVGFGLVQKEQCVKGPTSADDKVGVQTKKHGS